MAEKEYTCEDCCEFINLNTYCPVEGEFIDDRHKSPCAIFRPKSPPTVFARITASPGALAEEFVEPYTRWGEDGHLETLWRTNFRELSGMLFDTREEAIAATVAKLKEVCND